MAALAETDEIVILDVPLLVESKHAYPVAGLLVVDVDPEVAVRRLVEHRGMREDDVRARMARQATRAERLDRADHVVDNSGTPADLQKRVDEAWRWIEALRRGETPSVVRQGSTGTVVMSVPSASTNVTALGSSPPAITMM